MLHFAPLPDNNPTTTTIQPQPRKKRLKRRERDQLRVSPSIVDEETGRLGLCGCGGPGVGGGGVCQGRWRGVVITSPGEALRSVLLVVALAGLSLLTWVALHLQARLDATQHLIASGKRLSGGVTCNDTWPRQNQVL
ncbi:hypothetical protein Pmani_026169 [Petrolisthes manimaculis]|uniref:Uncharacterized protein n=1 Tax=Petrolisthes manimaculis TaxID=1843537 RepID=A0AAE1TXP0_9EUCA|nr:hypothetical protein Pmani_026169 [Petrolisthes manimaculis]